MLDTEIDNYENRAEGMPEIYAEVQDALLSNPDLTLAQIKRWVAQAYGLRFGEVGKVFRGLRTEGPEGRAGVPSQPRTGKERLAETMMDTEDIDPLAATCHALGIQPNVSQARRTDPTTGAQ